MPTQVPPGSAMAVKRVSGGGSGGHRRVKPRGPRLLKYAEGGMVHSASKMIEAGARMMGAKGAKNIDRAEKEAKSMKENAEVGHVEMKKETVFVKGGRARQIEAAEEEALK